MKKKKIFILGILLIAVCSLFTGCIGFRSRIDPEKHKWTVYYHANGGNLSGMEVREMHIMDDATLPVPNTTNMPKEVRQNYDSLGWYMVTLDENGDITTDENGEQIFGEKVNFLTKRVRSNFAIGVKWQKHVTYTFVPGSVEGEAALPDGFKISNPTVYSVTSLMTLTEPVSDKPKAEGYTLIEYFWDKECTQKVDFDQALTQEQLDDYSLKFEENSEYSIPIYTKWLKGEYTLVYTADEFAGIVGNKRYYLMNDIDMTNAKKKNQFGNFTGLIEGNNKTVSNLFVNVEQKRNTWQYGGIWVSMKGAEIRNLTLENVTINFEIVFDAGGVEPMTCNICVLAPTTKDCIFTNFKIKGQMDITRRKIGGVENNYNVDVIYYGLTIEGDPLQVVKSGTDKDEDGRPFEYTLN